MAAVVVALLGLRLETSLGVGSDGTIEGTSTMMVRVLVEVSPFWSVAT